VIAPTRRGFGSKLIERATASSFSGEVTLDYPSAGVRWRLRAPYAGLAELGRSEAF
jgi:two-component sensor histidine kinase